MDVAGTAGFCPSAWLKLESCNAWRPEAARAPSYRSLSAVVFLPMAGKRGDVHSISIHTFIWFTNIPWALSDHEKHRSKEMTSIGMSLLGWIPFIKPFPEGFAETATEIWRTANPQETRSRFWVMWSDASGWWTIKDLSREDMKRGKLGKPGFFKGRKKKTFKKKVARKKTWFSTKNLYFLGLVELMVYIYIFIKMVAGKEWPVKSTWWTPVQ